MGSLSSLSFGAGFSLTISSHCSQPYSCEAHYCSTLLQCYQSHAPCILEMQCHGYPEVSETTLLISACMTVQKHLDVVERYDPASDKWEDICPQQRISRSFMSAVVIDV